jgi:hypothetical protein
LPNLILLRNAQMRLILKSKLLGEIIKVILAQLRSSGINIYQNQEPVSIYLHE